MRGNFRSSPKIIIHKPYVPTTVEDELLWIAEIDNFQITQDIIDNLSVILSYTPITNTEHLLLNGLEMKKADGWDYTISGNTITFRPDDELTVGDFLVVKYNRLS